jgi:NDP-sugar pyrophosphorylase family protein
VITDGDIRRWILAGQPMGRRVTEVMNAEPLVLADGYSVDEARRTMLETRRECLPVVAVDGRIVGAVWWMDLFEAAEPEVPKLGLPVVIMAGGEGTRLSPYTTVLPKPLMPVNETPIVELIMERFARYGCTEFHLSLFHKANLIRAYFADLKHEYSINYVLEDTPLGTAGSLRLLASVLPETFFVSNCDILVDADYADVYEFHKATGNMITLVGSMKHHVVPYGVCDITDDGTLDSIREKPEYSYLVSTGLAILEHEVLQEIPEGGPFHMTELVKSCTDAGNKVGVYPVSDRCWLDIGQWEELQDTLKRFGGV